MKSLRLKLITLAVIKLKYLHRFVSRQKKDKSETNISLDQSENVKRIEKKNTNNPNMVEKYSRHCKLFRNFGKYFKVHRDFLMTP